MSMTINGSGTITGLQAGGLPNAVVTQPLLASGVGQTGPVFSAYASNSQAIVTATYTLLQYNTLDPAFPVNGWDGTNYKFRATVAGYYHVSATIYINGGISAAQSLLTMYRNGAEYKRGIDASAAGINMLTLSADVYLNGTTDEIAIYCFQASGATKNTVAGQPYSWVSGHLTRAA